MNFWLIPGLYIIYAFTQASFGVKFARDPGVTPVYDFIMHFIFAPLVLAYVLLLVPCKLLEAYANQLAK